MLQGDRQIPVRPAGALEAVIQIAQRGIDLPVQGIALLIGRHTIRLGLDAPPGTHGPRNRVF